MKTRLQCLTFLLAATLQTAASERPVASQHVDHSRLLAYVDEKGHERAVTTVDDWAHRRRDILAGMREAMGPLSSGDELVPWDERVTERVSERGLVRLSLSIAVEPGDRVPAYLLIPDPLPRVKRLPAILALHQTTKVGKAEPAGVAGNAELAYGKELALRGYVVLCPDYPTFGDYRYDLAAALKSEKYASGTMKGIFNHVRCVDYLQSRPEVDPDRVGVIGHSLGGHNAMFVAAFDQRIKAVVSSCGWTPFGDYYGGNIKGWTGDVYMPRLRDVYRLDLKAVPFDFYEVVAALAPRPFFSNSPVRDDNFAVAGVRKAEAAARPVFELLGAKDALQVRYPECGHEFPREMREAAYAFLDAALRPGRADE